MVKFFREFFPDAAIIESVKAAKDYLKSQALQTKKKQGGPDATLTPQEIKTLENDPDFVAIKRMCVGTPSLTFAFTKFFYDDLSKLKTFERLNRLQSIIQDLDFLKSKKLKLPIPFDQYANLKKETGKGPLFRIEKLESDIKELKEGWYIKSFVNKLLTNQKTWFKDLSADQRVEVVEVASKMSNLSAAIQNLFFKKVKRYKSYLDLMDNAKLFIKSSNSNLFANLVKVDSELGEGQYVEVLDEGGIVILEIKSYRANQIINSNTSHCIASRQSSWDDYVTTVTKQYYIYNLNLDPSDDWSVIGVTMKADGQMTAAHKKDDAALTKSRLIELLDSWGVDFDEYIKPPTEEELNKKRIIQAAKNRIGDEGITLEELKEFISLGVDPNESYGIAFKIALKEKAADKVEYLLGLGALDAFLSNNWTFAGLISDERCLKLILDANKKDDERLYIKILTDCTLDLDNFTYFFREKMNNVNPNEYGGILYNSSNLKSTLKILKPYLGRMTNYRIIDILYFKEEEVLEEFLPFFERFDFNDFRNLLNKRFDRINIFEISEPYLDKIEVDNLPKEDVDGFLGSLSIRRISKSKIDEFYVKFKNFIGPKATENYLCNLSNLPSNLSLDVFTKEFPNLESGQITKIIIGCEFFDEIKDEIIPCLNNLYSSDLAELISSHEVPNVELIMPNLKEYIGELTSNDIKSLLTECGSGEFFKLIEIVKEIYDELDIETKIEILKYWSGSNSRVQKILIDSIISENLNSRDIKSISEFGIDISKYFDKLQDAFSLFDENDSYNLYQIIRNIHDQLDYDDWDYLPLSILDGDDSFNLLRYLSDNSHSPNWVMCGLIPKLSNDEIESLSRYNQRDSNFIEFRVGLIEALSQREGEINLNLKHYLETFMEYFEDEGGIGNLEQTLKYISQKGNQNIIELLEKIGESDEDLYESIKDEFVTNNFLTQEELDNIDEKLGLK